MISSCKPKLSIDEQIQKLTSNGIKFNIMNEEQAYKYLENNNNYFRLTAYRKSFIKHTIGENQNKYIDLEFAYLVDLAIIDMRLRYILLHMALDVEHFTKIILLKTIDSSSEDGYEIVDDYFKYLSDDSCKILKSEISRNINNPFSGELLKKYEGNFPVWVFVEFLTFGSLTYFYKFCASRFNNKTLENIHYLLISIKNLRNAAAHNKCIIDNLSPNANTKQGGFGPNANTKQRGLEVLKALGDIGISRSIRERKMSNERIKEIATLLYLHKNFVSSNGVHKHRCKELNDVIDRMKKNIDYYKSNDTILTTFKFLEIIVDKWYTVNYNSNTLEK